MVYVLQEDPLNNILLSTVVAFLPIIFLFVSLAILRLSGLVASFSNLILTLIIVSIIYKMPLKVSLLSILKGVLFGFFTISWIIFNAFLFYRLLVRSGLFDVLRVFLLRLSSDISKQVVIICFCFGSLLEAIAGFGIPVAITSSILMGLGIPSIKSAGLALVANSTPVAFGGLGLPVIVGAEVSSIDIKELSNIVAAQLIIPSFLVPFTIVLMSENIKKVISLFPFLAICGLSYAISMYYSALFLGAYTPGVVASIVSLIVSILYLKYVSKEKNGYSINSSISLDYSIIKKAICVGILLIFLLGLWSLRPIKEVLGVFNISFILDGLHKVVIDSKGRPMDGVVNISIFTNPGTAILIVTIFTALYMQIRLREFLEEFINTFKTLYKAILTISFMLGFASLANYSGLTLTLSSMLTKTGLIFPFFSAFLGYIGTFITGSDTSSNALFAPLQATTAKSLGVDPVLAVATNTTGGVMGKMVSPQSITVATSATNMQGKEGDILRYVFVMSIFFLVIIGLISWVLILVRN